MLARSSGTAMPVCVRKGCMDQFSVASFQFSVGVAELPVADINKVPGDGGGSGHHGTDQVRAPAAALASLEVAVAGGSAALAGSKDVRIHTQAHGAARLAPLEARGAEDFVKAFAFRLPLHRLRTWNHHGPHAGMHAVAAQRARRRAQVLEPGVGAGTDKDAVH